MIEAILITIIACLIVAIQVWWNCRRLCKLEDTIRFLEVRLNGLVNCELQRRRKEEGGDY